MLYISIFSCIALLYSCSDLSSTIGADGTYRVSAYIGNMAPESKSMVRPEDSIRPSFITDISTDPDVHSLHVSVLNEREQLVSEYLYTVDTRKDYSEESAELNFVDSLNDRLPSFKLPSNIDPGTYVLVFRVFGINGLLTESRQYLYYLSNAEFTFKELRVYPPGKGPSLEKPLFPPGITILLEADISADPRLDPYVVWTFDSRTMHEAYLSEGGATLLWKTPALEALYSVQARLYPEKPSDKDVPGTLASVPFYSRNCSVPVSSTRSARLPGMDASSYDLFFRFLGNLYDDQQYMNEIKKLYSFTPTPDKEARWIPLGDSYGIAVGAGEQYVLDLDASFDKLDSLDIFLRLSPADHGSIFAVSFTSGMLSGLIQLEYGEEGYTLALTAADYKEQQLLRKLSVEKTAFIPVCIRLEQAESSLVVGMLHDESGPAVPLLEVMTEAEGFSVSRVSLGSEAAIPFDSETNYDPEANNPEAYNPEAVQSVPDTPEGKEAPRAYTAIIDEFGLWKNPINLDKSE